MTCFTSSVVDHDVHELCCIIPLITPPITGDATNSVVMITVFIYWME